jgi:glycosyl transferase family 25
MVQVEHQHQPDLRQPWPLLVVNLERNPERWRHARSAYASAGFAVERLPAVDGRELSDADIAAVMDAERNRRRYKRTLTRGEIGCYLSHRLAWSRIAASGAAGGYVFEDDIEPTEMLALAMTLIESRQPDWDMVKLFRGRAAARMAGGAGALSFRKPMVLSASTEAYAVSRQGAEKLLRHAARFFRPLDMDIKHWWERDLRVLVIQPSVVRHTCARVEESSIEGERRRNRRNPLVRFILNLRYQLCFRASLHRWQIRDLMARPEAGSRSPER